MVNEILETPAGELAQTWWCQGCQEWHTDSILEVSVKVDLDDEIKTL